VNKKCRQVPFFLCWPVEKVQFCVNSIGHFGWLSGISNFPRFQKNVSSLELLKYISENISPKGSLWCNKRKTEFSALSLDSPYLLSMVLKSSNTQYDIEDKWHDHLWARIVYSLCIWQYNGLLEIGNSARKSGEHLTNNLWLGWFVKDKIYEETS